MIENDLSRSWNRFAQMPGRRPNLQGRNAAHRNGAPVRGLPGHKADNRKSRAVIECARGIRSGTGPRRSYAEQKILDPASPAHEPADDRTLPALRRVGHVYLSERHWNSSRPIGRLRSCQASTLRRKRKRKLRSSIFWLMIGRSTAV